LKKKLKLKKISDELYEHQHFSIIKENNHWLVVDKQIQTNYIENTFVEAYKRILSINAN
jgi:hypothetical protein